MPSISNACRNRHGFTLIELLVVIAIIGVLVALLLPAVQAAREAARRAQCVNNLKQIALGLYNYQDVHGAFPMASYLQPTYSNPNWTTNGNAWTVGLLPFIEQQPLYNGYNTGLNYGNMAQLTAFATGINTFWCPSDWTVSTAAIMPASTPFFSWEAANYPGSVRVQFCSYAASTGSWFAQDLSSATSPIDASNNGMVFFQSCRGLADILDGTSNTILLGERGHGLLALAERLTWHWQFAPTRVLFTAEWPPNPQRVLKDLSVSVGNILNSNPSIVLLSASSFHPGGCNFAFVDGSVHFIQNSVDCWPIDPGTGQPLGLVYDANGVPSVMQGAKVGVYQALATCSGGEVISGGAY